MMRVHTHLSGYLSIYLNTGLCYSSTGGSLQPIDRYEVASLLKGPEVPTTVPLPLAHIVLCVEPHGNPRLSR